MKKTSRIYFSADERAAVESAIRGTISIGKAANILGCSYLQVQTLLGKLMVQGYQDGWVEIDFNRM